MTEPRSHWYVTPSHDSEGPFHAVAPDGTKHGAYDTWSDAFAHRSREQALLEKRELDEKARALTPLLQSVKARGATAVRGTYQGGGDEGNFEEVDAVGAVLTQGESDEVEEFFEYVLYQRHGGWENNEGGFGSFEIDLRGEEITIAHTHNDYVENYDTTEHSNLLVSELPPGEPALAASGG